MKNAVEYPVSKQYHSRSRVRWYVLPALLLAFLLQPVTGFSGEQARDTGYLFALAVADKPTVHGVGERIRIAKGLEPDRVAEFTGVHEAVSFPGDTDPDAEDFKEEAYGQLRAEIRMTFAELSSVRGRMQVVKESLELLRGMVLTSTGLYGEGRLDQGQALQAQLEWEKLAGSLQLLEKREKIYGIRMNVLTGAPTEDPVPKLQSLQEYRPDFDGRAMTESYKSRRFLSLFQQLLTPEGVKAAGDGSHGGDSLDVEAEAFTAALKISLETLYRQARQYRTALIPKAELAHKTRLELYKNGKLNMAAVVEGLLALAEMRQEYQALLGEAHVLRARGEYLTGVVLD